MLQKQRDAIAYLLFVSVAPLARARRAARWDGRGQLCVLRHRYRHRHRQLKQAAIMSQGHVHLLVHHHSWLLLLLRWL